MTDLLRAEAGSGNAATRPSPAPARPIAVSAAMCGLAVSAAGLVATSGLATIGWLTTGTGSPTGTLRTGALVWLVAHGSSIRLDGTAVTAVPLGLTMLIAIALAVVAGRMSARSELATGQDLAQFTAIATLCYAAVLGLVAVAASTDRGSVGVPRAVAVGCVIAAAGTGVGAARASGLLSTAWAVVPQDLRAAVRGATWGIGVMLVCSLVVTLGALLGDLRTFGRLWSSLGAGAVGGVGVALLCLFVLPNLVLWTSSVVLGPGFVLGTGSSVTLTHASLGQVPALPALAALPAQGALPAWAIALAVVPVLAGTAAGYVAVLAAPVVPPMRALLQGLRCGAAAGLGVGLLVAVSGGAIGPGRMSEVGPRTVLTLVTSIVVLAVGGALGGVLGHYRGRRADDAAGQPTGD